MTRTLSNEDLQMMRIVEERTGARVMDVVVMPATISFLVNNGDLGKAIGKNSINLHKLKKEFNKVVEFVEYADDLGQFIRNLFKPVEVTKMDIADENRKVMLEVDPENKGLAIGKAGEKINRARTLTERYYGVKELRIL